MNHPSESPDRTLWRATDTTRHHRENLWNYKGRGFYHFTLNVEGRYPLFGRLEGDSAEEAHIVLSALGEGVVRLFRGIPMHQAQRGCTIRVLALCVMPDHLHGVLRVVEPMPKSVGEVIRGFKSACTSLYKREFAEGDTAFRPFFMRHQSIWEFMHAGYHERIMHRTGQYKNMVAYALDNPRRLWLKTRHPNLFCMRHQLSLRFTNEEGQMVDWRFRALGNLFLLDAPLKQEIQCSRSLDEAQLRDYLTSKEEQACQGAVSVSAAISQGEKVVCRRLREAHHPLVILLKDGFPAEHSPHERFYKPGGVYFDACAAGRLLLLEPNKPTFADKDISAAVYRRSPQAPPESLRYQFLALNRIAWVIANAKGTWGL